jgi:hypothetical protein
MYFKQSFLSISRRQKENIAQQNTQYTIHNTQYPL